MSWLDKSCLQLVVKRKDKPETLTFQVRLSSYFLSNFGDLAMYAIVRNRLKTRNPTSILPISFSVHVYV